MLNMLFIWTLVLFVVFGQSRGDEICARPKSVTLCMMVKDESSVVTETLLNMLPYIDRYDITDTGSTDGTPELIRSFMQNHSVPGTVYHTEWNGFGDHGDKIGSQTVMFSNCYLKADYLFQMDADDSVVGSFVYPTSMNKDSYTLKLRVGSVAFSKRKLFSGSIRWRAFGPIHEYVGADVGFESGVLDGDYHILARARGDEKKYERYAKILEDALLDEPDNSRYQFYLAQSYHDAGLTKKSLSAYLKRAKMGGWNEEVFYSLYQSAVLKQRLDYPFADVHAQYLEAYRSHPGRAEPLHALSRLFRQVDKPEIAYLYAKASLACRPLPQFLFVNKFIYEEGVLDEVCATAWYAGAYFEGLDACGRLEESPRVKVNIKFYKDKLR